MNRQQILDAIPHREPFLLVDEIVERTDGRIVGRKTFTGQEDFFAGHYPGYPLVPGVLLCEAAMQCGAILLSRHFAATAGKVPVATRMNDVRFKRMVRPGETIANGGGIDRAAGRRLFPQGQGDCRRQGRRPFRVRLHGGG